ncbi:hypothetical protein LMG19282_04874 [Cupriavidus campinensis]|jgi:hypothetical protein|uniref:2OG-Fe(II) oxygenase n=1 Tax=Cupriavidus campinensis TaxID=151783 RepID=A0ABY3EW17_9BURK|nr:MULTISPECIES: hypothetical protein [Cupriavidus]TSP14798.1 hypothetical protein FGG12_01950 [Cupriavidus campinensis]CAG2155253.1 hypothetical protein LMG19282_04874 [Cupriavidus campinensis]
MHPIPQPSPVPLISYFWSDDAIRSRSVSDVVLSGTVEIPEPPARLRADWEREIASNMTLEPGDVEPMSLPRARMRWPDYPDCVQAVSDWASRFGMPLSNDIALMACHGARYHHDGEQYGGLAFCNLFLSEDKGLDVHFPALDLRIPLRRGTVMIFDTCQPHGVIRRGSHGFDLADFPADHDWTQLFLSWELPVESAPVEQALHVKFDIDPATAATLHAEQVRRHGERVNVRHDSGQWRPAD